MIDFKINNSGDLVLRNNADYPKFKLNFSVSKHPAMCISFNTVNSIYEEDEIAPKSMEIRFETDTYSSNGVSNSSVNDIDQIKQLIMLRARTEYGDLANIPFGSNMYLMKHLDIRSKEVHNNIQKIIYDIVKDLLDNPSVIVKVEKSNSYFYCQNINIYIYEDGELLFSFPLNS